MNHKRSYIYIFFMLFSIALPVSSMSSEKPVIAINHAKIAENISENARNNLDIEKLLAEMEASFLATRKFNVVTRNKTTLEAIDDEQQFANSDFSAGDAAESGNLQNADFLIVPEVYKFSFYSSNQKVPNLQSKYFRRDHGTLEINAQIIDTKTGQIKTSFSLKDDFSTNERMVNGKGGLPNKKYFSDMAKNVSAQMADQFIALVFPVEVISVKGDTVYLNRGQDGGFKVGALLNVYLRGEVLTDPHTGEQLGSAEEFIGKVKISRVNPKFTIATTVQDTMKGTIVVGSIVRKP